MTACHKRKGSIYKYRKFFNVGLRDNEHCRMCKIIGCYGSNDVTHSMVSNHITKNAVLGCILCEGLYSL
jgi:hypothetical protein